MSTPLDIAVSQLGVEESPRNSNWGPKIKDYLAAGGCFAPAPWCVAFLVWCFRHAESKACPLTASSTFLLNWGRERGKLVKQPQPGDVFLLLRPDKKNAFHAGFVRSVGKLTFATVEGNSNSTGSSEGYAVVSRTRSRLGRVAFVRV